MDRDIALAKAVIRDYDCRAAEVSGHLICHHHAILMTTDKLRAIIAEVDTSLGGAGKTEGVLPSRESAAEPPSDLGLCPDCAKTEEERAIKCWHHEESARREERTRAAGIIEALGKVQNGVWCAGNWCHWNPLSTSGHNPRCDQARAYLAEAQREEK